MQARNEMGDPTRSSGKNVQAASEKVLAEGATQAVVAAGASMGVPPALGNAIARSGPAQKLIKRASKGGAVAVRGVVAAAKVIAVGVLVLPLLLVALLVTSVVSVLSPDPVPPPPQPLASDAARYEIPPRQLSVYEEVATRYQIPWTLLAAVGELTGHGRVDPYGRTGLTLTAEPKRVLVVGDSLTVGIERLVGPALSPLPVSVDAAVGRRTREAPAALGRLNPGPDSIVVIGLGTNDGPSTTLATEIDAAVAAANGAPVLWLNVHLPDPVATDAVNALLDAATERHPNLLVLDWAAVVADDPSLLTTDRIHLTASEGYPRRSEFVTQAVAALDSDARRSAMDDARCPVSDPPIGGGRAAGAGPLLLRPDTLVDAGLGAFSDSALQNLCTSAALLARHLSELAREVAQVTGIDINDAARDAAAGDEAAALEVQIFWSLVLDEVTIVADPAVRSTGCALPHTDDIDEQRGVAVWIQSLWRCQLAGDDLVAVVDLTTEPTGDRLPVVASNPLAQYLSEALSVAWWWSSWGEAPCDATAPLAGVFPLSEDVFAQHLPTEFAGRDRCDRQANIAAAAAAFAAGERVPFESRTGSDWERVVGGWSAIGTAAGSPETRETFAQSGPWRVPDLSPRCALAVGTELRSFAVTRPEVTVDLDQASEAQLAALDQALEAFVVPSASCPEIPADGFTRSQVLAAQAAVEYRAGLDEFQDDAQGADSALALTLALETMAGRWQQLALQQSPGPPIPGVDALVPRLSPTPRVYALPLAAPAPRPVATTELSYRFFEVALRLGGFYEGDPGFNLLTGSSGASLGVPVVVETSDQHKGQVIDDRASPELIAADPACGGGRGRAEMVERWNRMCADAVAAGVPMRQIGMHRTSQDQANLLARRGGWAAPVGQSRHQTGTAVDINVDNAQVRHWLHNIVGCFDLDAKSYFPFANEVDFTVFAAAVRAEESSVVDIYGTAQPTCAGQVPIKRIQTYGLLFNICGQRGVPANLAQPEVIECTSSLRYDDGRRRVVENWHAEPGVLLVSAAALSGFSLTSCGIDPEANTVNGTFVDPGDRQLLAAATYLIFSCLTREAGLEQMPPSALANGSGPPVFANKAQQVASEAVVVGFCESGFNRQFVTENNRFGYGGVFQMGDAEMERFAPGGAAAKFVPVANIVGAARYYLYGHGRAPWDGWGPWAVVNTDYGGSNDAIKYPVLPRFPTTQPGYFGRAPGSLPGWALDPLAPGFTLPDRCRPALDLGPWP